MHDWTLVRVSFEWGRGVVTLDLLDAQSRPVSLLAEQVSLLHVPQLSEWGASISVNRVTGPLPISAGKYKMEIEMQSGDVIAIEAGLFILPSAQ